MRYRFLGTLDSTYDFKSDITLKAGDTIKFPNIVIEVTGYEYIVKRKKIHHCILFWKYKIKNK